MSLEHIIANNVLRYLPPRDLLHTVTCSKSMIDYMSYTTVIQTLLFGGLGVWSRQSLEAIINLLREGKIWKPTPLRLLRLCLARRCEAKKDCPGKPQHVNERWGVFFCWSCIQKMGTEVKPSMRVLTEALKNPRVSKYSKYLLTKDHIRVKTERCGPLVTVQTLERLKKDGKTLDEFFASADVKVCAPSDPQIMEIIKAYEERAIWAREIDEKEKLRKKEAQLERESAKKAKLETVETKLEALLEDQEKAEEVGLQLDLATIQKSPHYEQIIKDIKAAPSKANKKLLEEIATSIRVVFCGIEKDILSRLSNPKTRFERLLLDAFNVDASGEGVSPSSFIIARANRTILAMMKQDMYWESLLWLVAYYQSFRGLYYAFRTGLYQVLESMVPPAEHRALFRASYNILGRRLLSPFMDLLPEFKSVAVYETVNSSSSPLPRRSLEEATGSKHSHMQVQRDLEAATTKIAANADRLRAVYRSVSDTFVESFIAQYEDVLKKHQAYLSLDWLGDAEKKADILTGPRAQVWHAKMRNLEDSEVQILMSGDFPRLLEENANGMRWGW